MNLKKLIIALIIALVYEILLKVSHILMPSLFNFSPIPHITSVFSFIIGIVIILFMCFFYKEEKSNNQIKVVLKILIGCIVLHFLIKLSIAQTIVDFKILRLIGEILGFIKAVLFFGFVLLYKKEIPSNAKLITQATDFLAVMFGIGIIKSLYSLINFARFVILEITINYSPIFYEIMFILFLITHASMIYFLYCYYQLKFKLQKTKYMLGKNL